MSSKFYEERHRTLNDHLCDMERCYARWNIREYDDLSRGLHIYVSSLIYQHGIHNRKITCLYMKKLQTTEPTKCKIYNMMIRNKGLTQKNLCHLTSATHFVNEYKQKPVCKYGDQCPAFMRLDTGGNKIEDQCHVILFRHPPRKKICMH